MRRLSVAILLVAAVAGGVPKSGLASDAFAWETIGRARAYLAETTPTATSFVQSYTPSGFSTADSEHGTLALRLETGDREECVRWDYLDPFPKGFLLCGRVAWSWTPGDDTGRRWVVGPSDSFGLDLLTLSLEELRENYEPDLPITQEASLSVTLRPTGPAAREISDATLLIEPGTGRLLALSYHDVEGNLTTFTFGEFEPVASPATIFTPPAKLAWIDE